MGKWAETNRKFFGEKDFLKWIVVVLMAVVLSAGVCFAGTLPEFEKMKSLVGDWKGTSMDGKPATLNLHAGFK